MVLSTLQWLKLPAPNLLQKCSQEVFPWMKSFGFMVNFQNSKICKGDQTFLGLNLAKMGLNFEAPAHPFHPGAPNGDVNMQTNGDYEVLKHSFPMLAS